MQELHVNVLFSIHVLGFTIDASVLCSVEAGRPHTGGDAGAPAGAVQGEIRAGEEDVVLRGGIAATRDLALLRIKEHKEGDPRLGEPAARPAEGDPHVKGQAGERETGEVRRDGL